MNELLGFLPEIKGIGSEGVVILSIVYLLDKLGVWRKLRPKINIIFGKNTPNHNNSSRNRTAGTGGCKPGTARECIDHAKELVRLETKVDGLQRTNENEHQRLDKNITRIFELIDKLKNGIRGGG